MQPEIEGLKQRLLDPDEHAAYDAAFELHKLGRPALEAALKWTRDIEALRPRASPPQE